MGRSLWRLETSPNCKHFANTFSSPESIPSLLLKMKELQVLDLRNNSLSSGIPDEIGNLANISLLALSLNNLIGGIPASIKQMERLHKLRLDGNSLFGEIPAWYLTSRD
ncbi:hypothetical protein AAC387_Pa01g2881 [Persea americana]